MKTQKLLPNKNEIEIACDLLKSGEVVGIPTETVYGLAADALNPLAVRKIFEAKGRPGDNPLIVHVSSLDEIKPLVDEIPPLAEILAKRFWPGPLTLIMKKSDTVPLEVTAGLDTVAIRMPSHPVAREIIATSGLALAAPSANLSGSPSPTCADHVLHDMEGRIPAVVDGGECDIGLESTVLYIASDKPRLLRPGAVTVEEIEDTIGPIDIDPSVTDDIFTEKVASPGMKYKHYSPKAKVTVVNAKGELFAKFVNQFSDDGIFALCFEEEKHSVTIPCMSVGSKSSQTVYAKSLFGALRELDCMGAKEIYAHCPSLDGIGLAVYNRLIRAAAFKIVTPRECTVLGLTGATGSGKTTVSKHLETMGAAIIDCDKIARDIIKNKAVIESLILAFGDITDDCGQIDRKALARAAFADGESTQLLNDITHPAIIDESMALIEAYKKNGKSLIVIDAPLLFEANMQTVCDATLSIVAQKDIRLERIIKRDSLDIESAVARINAQKDDEFYSASSDYTINNNGDEAMLLNTALNTLFDIGVIINGK